MSKTCANGHPFEKTSDCPTCPICERDRVATSAIPKIGAPATRALEKAGVHGLEDLADWTERDLLAMHGMGPRAVGILREHLAERGLSLKS
jgi:hypothetical protein